MIEELAPGVVVVGTAHVSAKSVADVESTIRARRPAKVLVELDPRRLQALQDPDAWRKTDIVQVIRDGKQHLFLLQLYLAAMQARMGRETGVAPGSELLKAVETAKEVGAEVVLMDRDIGLTLRRAFDGLGLQQRAGLALNVLLEMLPTPPAEPARPPLAAWRHLLPPLLALAALAAFDALRLRLASGVDRILDLLIGFPTAPAVTITLVAGIAGAILAALWPLPRRQAVGWAQQAGGALWSALALGILAAWTWGFTEGFGLPVLAALLPGPTPLAAAWIALAGWSVLGAVLGARLTHLVRVVTAQRHDLTRPDLDIDALLQQDAITQMTDEFARFAPSIKRVLIDERDTYMASHIAEQAGPGGVVAIVGAGHLAGIRAGYAQARAQDRAPLDLPPAARLSTSKVLAWAVPLALVGVFLYLGWRGIQEGNFQDLLQSLGWFALITATCSALGAAVALGHPYSIAAAFVAAPIATLHPLIASGWFAGLVEAKVRTPTVADFEAIKTLQTLGQFWRNGVVRILLVTAITNVGAMVGFWIATGRVLQILGGST